MLKKQIKALPFFFILGISLLVTTPGYTAQLQIVNILNVLTYDTPPLSYEENRQIADLVTKNLILADNPGSNIQVPVNKL
ncbi:MAG: hypothetical protein KAI40_10660 [Desulfobacterales bacterium]|nr:hypothetical protein [Desulfobacterales bacterium]